MSVMHLNWPLIITLIAISALAMLQPRSKGSRRQQLNVETGKAHLGEIEIGLQIGNRNTAASWKPSQDLRASARKSIVPAAVFLFVAGVGAAASYMGALPAPTGSNGTTVVAEANPEPDAELLALLADYSRSIAAGEVSSAAPAGEPLPDVDSMIERLAARLETTPDDIGGWRMLGWSYFHTGRYDEAVSAYAKAVELDPSSAELKLSYEEAKAKASETANLATAASVQTAGDGNYPLGVDKKPEAMPTHERDAAIRSMVDGLAARLERSPRDADGWTRLMRSYVVLGEREVAATALRKALEVFKDDSAASGTITAAATELGLTAE